MKRTLVVLLTAATLVTIFVVTQLDSEIRRRVEERIAEHYQQLEVHVASARLIDGRGVEILGLSLRDPKLEGPGADLFSIDEILVACRTDWKHFIQNQLQPDIRQVLVRRPRIRLFARPDGSWNFSQLLPLPKFGDQSPRIVIEQCAVEFCPSQGGKEAEPLVLGSLDMTLTSASPTSASSGKRIALQGTWQGPWIGRAEFSGTLQPDEKRWRVAGTVHAVRASSALWRFLPPKWNHPLAKDLVLESRGDVRFEIDYDPDRVPVYQFNVRGNVTEGRLSHRLLTGALTGITAQVGLNTKGLEVQRFEASWGSARVSLSGRRPGWGDRTPLKVNAEIKRLHVDRPWFQAATEPIASLGAKYQPEGWIDALAELVYDGSAWHSAIHTELREFAFTFHRFPYRLRKARGEVHLIDQTVNLDLVASAGDRPVMITGQLANPGPEGTGWLRIHGDDVLVDSKLLAALPPRAARILQTLHPNGVAQIDWNWKRNDPAAPKPNDYLKVLVRDGAIRYDKFPYPLRNIHGTIQGNSRRWDLVNLVGEHGSGTVILDGSIMAGTPLPRLDLKFQGTDLALDEPLQAALPGPAQQVWNQLHLQGRVHATARVRTTGTNPKPDLVVTLQPVSGTVSIEPDPLPYRLEQLAGTLTYQHGNVRLENVTGQHGPTQVSASGSIDWQPEGDWSADMKEFTVRQVQFDHDLSVALPAGLRALTEKIRPTRPFDLTGSLQLSRQAGPGSPVASRWDLACTLDDPYLDCGGLPLEQVRGTVRLTGSADGEKYWSTTGQLDLATVRWKNIPFTQVRGPLLAEPGRILFGGWVGKQRHTAPRYITAKLLDGAVVGEGWVATEGQPGFNLSARVDQANLAEWTALSAPDRPPIHGTLTGTLALEETTGSPASRSGRGKAVLNHADIYELPLVVALLKVLSARLPDKNGFNECRIAYRIQGDQVTFDQLDLLGDAVNLFGKGNMDFQRNVQLAFHTNFRESALPVPFVRKLIGKASEQILQIYVNGTLDNPQVHQQPFPGMSQALQSFQADLERTTRDPTRLMDVRQWFQGQPDQIRRR